MFGSVARFLEVTRGSVVKRLKTHGVSSLPQIMTSQNVSDFPKYLAPTRKSQQGNHANKEKPTRKSYQQGKANKEIIPTRKSQQGNHANKEKPTRKSCQQEKNNKEYVPTSRLTPENNHPKRTLGRDCIFEVLKRHTEGVTGSFVNQSNVNTKSEKFSKSITEFKIVSSLSKLGSERKEYRMWQEKLKNAVDQVAIDLREVMDKTEIICWGKAEER
jgi:hypothetical protein